MIGPTGSARPKSPAASPSSPARPSSRSRRPNSPRSAMSAAMSSRSCATCSRSASVKTRERKRKDVQARAHLAAEERVVDALVGATAQRVHAKIVSARNCAPANSTTRRSRSRCRQRPAAACRCSKCPECRAPRWAPSRSAIFSANGRPHQDQARRRQGFHRASDQRGIR